MSPLPRTFALASAKVGKQYDRALRFCLGNLIGGAAGLLILAGDRDGKPCDERSQMFRHTLIDDMLPILAQLFSDRGLLGAAQPHDIIASL